jgi:hypothetical protein
MEHAHLATFPAVWGLTLCVLLRFVRGFAVLEGRNMTAEQAQCLKKF